MGDKIIRRSLSALAAYAPTPMKPSDLICEPTRALQVRRYALGVVTFAACLLSGCALAPGVNLTGQVPKPAPVDLPPPGALISITPDLVRALRSVPVPDPTEDLKPFLVEPEAYRIGAADVLSITVWGSPEFSQPVGNPAGAANNTGGTGFTVSSKGFIQVPYIGSVKAAGLTEEELRDKLSELLQSMLKKPQVTVAVQTYRSGRIYVDGEVRNPGQLILNDVPMTLPEALFRAGGITTAADRSAVMVTRGVKSVRINIDQLTSRGVDPQRILLARNDTVRVASNEDTRVYVLGEVNGAGAKPFRKGRLTLHEALGDAGGVSSTSGDPRQIYVIRVTDPLKPEIFHLDAASPVALALADGFDLKPRDVVYVDPVPLVRWNRVINLILPSATAAVVTNQAVTRSN
jgi:polysaccharide export outer membrane protein